MRILFIVPYAPSLIRVRPYQLIRWLARRGHDVVVATLWTSPEERVALQDLAQDKVHVRARRLPPWRSLWNCAGALRARIPLQSVYSWQPELATEITTTLCESPFDVVHVEHLRGALYGVHARRALRENGGRTPIIWDSVDCISHLFRQARHQSRSLQSRWMTRLELSRTESFEARLAGQFDCVLVTSRVDGKAIEELARARAVTPPPELRILCNGVDLEYFSVGTCARDPATLVLTGKMSYHANITAARHLVGEIMPLVWARRPETRVMIVGKDPPRQIRSLSRTLAKANRSGISSRVVVAGTVPDIRPYLWRATVAVAPVPYGAGVQNKTLEAMACGVPVVASPQAISALSVRDGRDLLLGESSEAFAQRVVDLLDDPCLRDNVGRAGRTYVEKNHRWSAVASSLESVYREVIDKGATKHACA